MYTTIQDVQARIDRSPNSQTVRGRLLAMAAALADGEMNETPITTCLGGTSGTGQRGIRDIVRCAAALGYLRQRKRGRALYYTAAPALLEWARQQPDYEETRRLNRMVLEAAAEG